MDLNIVVLAGAIAAEPEFRTFDSGARFVRFLITTRSSSPRRRVDVVPVTLWDPPDDLAAESDLRHRKVWVVGSVQRRFWSTDGATRSRVEVVAHHVELRDHGAGKSGESQSAA